MFCDSSERDSFLKGVCVYAGTFDPITNGHLDVISRTACVFERVIVAVANTDKPNLLFSLDQRVVMVREAVAKFASEAVEVVSFSGLLVKFVRAVRARVIIRGLRAVSDYDYESQMAVTNRQLDPSIETFFVMTSKEFSFISSSVVKEIAKNGGDYSEFVPKHVAENLWQIYGK